LKDVAVNAGIDIDDPNIAFLLEGGFAYYDSARNFIGALSLASTDTEYYMHFGEPVKLSDEDVQRLHIAGRWVKTTSKKTTAAGAQYFTFINPNEQLAGAAFPPMGCFAFLFRHPSQPADERDRYFPITPIE
jgi:hypothetical protein